MERQATIPWSAAAATTPSTVMMGSTGWRAARATTRSQGAPGTDSFVFREAGAANADVLTDFATGWDDLLFDAAGFAGVGAAGRFAAGDARFYAAAGASGGHTVDDRFVFNTSTGQLYY